MYGRSALQVPPSAIPARHATTYVAVERCGLAELTGQGWAIITLLLMVVVSVVILRKVTDEKRDWDALRAA